MRQNIRFGIIGTGNIARQFATGLSTSNRCVLQAVASRNLVSARIFAQAFNCAQAYGFYDELLSDSSVDAVYISLPNTMHHEWTLRALRAGKHVLCEKPMAITSAQAIEMFDIAKQCGCVLIEAFMYRAHPQTLKMMELIKEGQIGQPMVVRTSFCYRTRKIEGNIRFDPALAGGALMDIGCYCISFAQLIAGTEPDEVHAIAKHHVTRVDEMISGLLKFPSGLISQFSCGMGLQADNSASVCGDEGYLTIPIPWKPPAGNGQIIVARATPPRQDNAGKPVASLPPTIITIDDKRDVYAVEADAFAECVLDSTAPFVSPDDTIANMRTIERVRMSAGLNNYA